MLKSFVGCLISEVKYTSLCNKQNGFRAVDDSKIYLSTYVIGVSGWVGYHLQ